MRQKLLFLILFLSLGLFFIHNFALSHNLYFTVSWIDTVTHSIAGGVLAGIFLFINSFKKDVLCVSEKKLLWFVFIIGIIWEIFELVTHQTVFTDKGYLLDTAGDLFFDVFGAFLFYTLTGQNNLTI